MDLNHNLQEAFQPIRATDDLKQSMKTFVHTEILRRQRKASAPVRYAFACCAMLAVMVCGVGSYQVYQAPVSYISVDVNPSVELALNRFDRVVDAAAFNDDGAEILQNLNLKNKPYIRAVELLLADETFERYLSGDALLSFTVVSDKEEALLAGIQQCQGYAKTNAECNGANAQLMEDAHHNGLSFGKYQAFLELAQFDSSITPEDCKNLSMRQIRDLINGYQGGSDTSAGCGQGNGGRGQGNGRWGAGGGYGRCGGEVSEAW